MKTLVTLDVDRVERRRISLGMLKYELAQAAGVHGNSITAATNGRAVGLVVAKKVAAALGVKLKTLIDHVVASADQAKLSEPTGTAPDQRLREAI
ncbi:MAG: helix-turn-helix transcriptional regulator [Planctomycetota bacterium]